MEKTQWKTLRMTLAVGEVLAEKEITLEKGKRIVSAVVKNRQPVQLVSVGLFENNTQVSAPMNLKFWERSNSGQYLDGFKPLAYNGGSQISVRLAANAAITVADLEIEIAFGIIKDDTEC
jgi:hypothetical protein